MLACAVPLFDLICRPHAHRRAPICKYDVEFGAAPAHGARRAWRGASFHPATKTPEFAETSNRPGRWELACPRRLHDHRIFSGAPLAGHFRAATSLSANSTKEEVRALARRANYQLPQSREA